MLLNKNDNPIIFFDSGVGGMPYLIHLRAQLLEEKFIYIADSKNFPYGDKNEELLISIILDIFDKIIKKFKPKIIVVACNTASVTALDRLRARWDIPFVGVVPAIKTATSITKNDKIGILATNRTINGIYLRRLIDKFSSDKEIFLVGSSDIVSFVENDLFHSSKEEIDLFIEKSVLPMKEYNVDSIVLGCTHFLHVSDAIKKALGGKVQIVDSREGVSNQVKRILGLNKRLNSPVMGLFYTTKELGNCKRYKTLCSKSGLEYCGEF